MAVNLISNDAFEATNAKVKTFHYGNLSRSRGHTHF